MPEVYIITRKLDVRLVSTKAMSPVTTSCTAVKINWSYKTQGYVLVSVCACVLMSDD